jgi:hypothetical protein
MNNSGIVPTVLGFAFNLLGFIWAFFDKLICGSICNGVCKGIDNSSCSLISLFVGILFIVSGYALIKMGKNKRKRIKSKIKREIVNEIKRLK